MKINLDQDEVSQDFDLQEIFEVDFDLPEEVAEAFAQEAIDTIRARTAKRKDIDGNDLPSPYSESYANSLEFKAFGKSKNKVNMKLTGEMLESIDILDNDGNSVKIGLEGFEATKAFAHNTGFEGHPVLDGQVPKRKFFGLNDDEVQKIKRKLKPLIPESGNEFEFNEERSLREVNQEINDEIIDRAIERVGRRRGGLVNFRIEDLFEDD